MSNKLLAVLDDRVVHNFDTDKSQIKWTYREASRGIVLLNDKIILMNVSNKGYYKLPGGGTEKSESPEATFVREVKEETGYEIEATNYMGDVLEFRFFKEKQEGFMQQSHCFVGKAISEHQYATNLDEYENIDGFETLVVSIDEVKNYFNNDITDYSSKFMVMRETIICDEYINNYLN
jgi:8-oxo-dGTP diphosphatase